MSRKHLDEVTKKINLSGIDIARIDYEEDTSRDWFIYLDTIKKIRIVWRDFNRVLTVEEETNAGDNGLSAWKKIYATSVINYEEIVSVIDEMLNPIK